MSAIDKVKKSRGIDELAERIEPLARSMATLADDARRGMIEIRQASEQQATAWSRQQQETMTAWRQAAEDMRQAASELNSAATTARSAARGWTWRLWAGVLVASVMPIPVLLIASWILLEPSVVTREGVSWLILKLN